MDTMKNFELMDVSTVEVACRLLSRYGKEAKLIAGGTDILLKWKDNKATYKYLINLLEIKGLDRIESDSQGTLRIGTLTRIQSIVDSTVIREECPVLAEAAEQLGSPQVRNMATLGGNLCNASPSADMAPPLIALGSKAILNRITGTRTILIEDLFVGPSETSLAHEEMLFGIEIPAYKNRSGAAYVKFGPRRAMDIALVGVGVFVQLDREGQRFEEVRIVLGAVAPIPLRARKAEEFLRGREVREDLIHESAAIASKESRPISDVRASSLYRSEMVSRMMMRGLELALARARGSNS